LGFQGRWRRRMRSATEIIFRPWRAQNSRSCATRAMVPSSFMISQMTPAGARPARRARSHGCFRLAGAHQHAPFPRAQGKDMAGPRQVLGPAFRIDGGEDGAGAVGGGDAGGDARAGVMDSQKAVPKLEVFWELMSGSRR